MARTSSKGETKSAATPRAKTGESKSAASAATPPKSSWRQVTAAERHQMIQFAAYMKAEKRGFKNGDPLRDWVDAEREVEAWLKSQGTANRG